jgi:hypothetical protein
MGAEGRGATSGHANSRKSRTREGPALSVRHGGVVVAGVVDPGAAEWFDNVVVGEPAGGGQATTLVATVGRQSESLAYSAFTSRTS